MATKTTPRASARDRLLTAANELFYEEGIQSVGIDRVIDRAGVAKASLYNTFGSKDELVRLYLESRLGAREARIAAKLAQHEAPRDKLLAIFDVLGDLFAEPGFRGCAFLNASAEAKAGTAVEAVCINARAWVHGLFRDLAAQAGAVDPDVLADQLVLQYDGATVAAQMDHNPRAAAIARSVAEALLAAAVPV
jgi:AcrR family transcriptional regulator